MRTVKKPRFGNGHRSHENFGLAGDWGGIAVIGEGVVLLHHGRLGCFVSVASRDEVL